MIHQLKLVGTDLADAVADGRKSYEIRVNDRNYQVGDLLLQSLYDTEAGLYRLHPANNYLYLVTFKSKLVLTNMEVLAIRCCCESIIIKRELVRKFKEEGGRCDIYATGANYPNSKISNVSNSSVTIEYDNYGIMLPIADVIWITPVDKNDVENRSVDMAIDIKPCQFFDYETYMMYRSRHIKCE